MRLLHGDALSVLRDLPAETADCCVTSPPYYGLRDYGVDGQIGLEDTPQAYVERLVEVFREVRRVLKPAGTLWLNLGDSYAGVGKTGGGTQGARTGGAFSPTGKGTWHSPKQAGLKVKDLIGIPWRVAFALQADGWWLRQDIIWSKPNPMPESVRDRCTKAHEYVFLMSKSERYHFDADAIKEPATNRPPGNKKPTKAGREYLQSDGEHHRTSASLHNIGARETRNRRSVWTITPKPFKGAHFATMPVDLARDCMLAGCPEGGTVLDPFGGAGTTAVAAVEIGRDAVLIELNAEYIAIAQRRVAEAQYGEAFASLIM